MGVTLRGRGGGGQGGSAMLDASSRSNGNESSNRSLPFRRPASIRVRSATSESCRLVLDSPAVRCPTCFPGGASVRCRPISHRSVRDLFRFVIVLQDENDSWCASSSKRRS